jgi:hypothetical protein
MNLDDGMHNGGSFTERGLTPTKLPAIPSALILLPFFDVHFVRHKCLA